jgi:hypothetical protein
MVRASKPSSAEKSVVVPAPVAPVETAPVEVAPAKKARKSKAVAPVETLVETPVVAPPEPVIPANEAVSAPVEEVAVAPPVPSESQLIVKLTEFGAKLQQVSALQASLKAEFKALEKTITKNEKTALKNSHKKKKASGNRAPSGFVKPTLITDELATFLGKSHGTKLARTEVSKELHKYIREHNLQNTANGRRIVPDEKLSALLKLKEGDDLTYFNLQKFLKYHFIKESAPVVATA